MRALIRVALSQSKLINMYDKYLILLDAGHGGLVNGKYVTLGKRSPIWSDGTQYFEGVGNREVRKELSLLLTEKGIKNKFLTVGNEDIPLKERTDLANKLSLENGVSNTFVYSLHSNGADNEKAHGLEFFTSPGQTTSDIAATYIAKSFNQQFPKISLRVDMSDGDIDKESPLWMTKQTIAPCVLGEHFFHTNERECKDILMNKEGQKKIAYSIYLGIVNYLDWLNTKDK